MPWSISVEPTNICNLSCPECPTGTNELSRPKGKMQIDLFENIIMDTKRNAFFLNLYFQGEPFLNKNLINMIIIAKKNKFYTCCATNAHFINKELATKVVSSELDQLVISYDGTTQEAYQKYRIGGNLDTVINAIKMLVEEKKKLKKRYPIIVLQFLVLKHNEHQMMEAKEFAKSFGVDNLIFKTVQLYDISTKNQYYTDNPLHTRYIKQSDGTLILKQSGNNRCWKSWSSCVVTWDGNIVPCCFDKNADYTYGTLMSNSFKELIFDKKSINFKSRILTNRKGINICSNCSEG